MANLTPSSPTDRWWRRGRHHAAEQREGQTGMTATIDPPDAGETRARPLLVLDGVRTRVAVFARENRAFTVALVIAVLLRLLVTVAYWPALEFFGDSGSYLANARNPFALSIWHPFGYPVVLWLLSHSRSLAIVPLLQHVMGLASGLLVYRLVRGFGVGAAGGVLASAPLLFDAYQIDVEHIVLSDTMFTLLAVIAFALAVRLLRTPSTKLAVAVGAVLAFATLTRTVGFAVALPLLAALVLCRIGWRRFAAAAATFAVPLAMYALVFRVEHGVFGLQGWSGRYSYGYVAPFASCHQHRLLPSERPLCPTLPTYARAGVNQFVWSDYSRLSGLPVQQIHRSQIAGQFARRIMMHQPADVVVTAAGNFVHYFARGRVAAQRDWYVGAWQFPLPNRPPAWNISPAVVGFGLSAQHGDIIDGLAHVLRAYQSAMYVPGPALLVAVIAAGAAVCLRRQRRETRWTVAALGASGLALLVAPSLSAGFDWRYLLPAQALLACAGVVGAKLLQPHLRRLFGRALPLVAAAVAVAVVVPDVITPSMYSEAAMRPQLTLSVPAVGDVGGHALVSVGRPTLLSMRCPLVHHKPSRLVAAVGLPVDVQYLHGPALLVQSSNFALTQGYVVGTWTEPDGRPLPNVLISGRYPRTSGTLYAFLTEPATKLRYVDPFGGGAAGWSFAMPAPLGLPEIGATCAQPRRWASGVLQANQLAALPPFTGSSDQRLTYGTAAAWGVNDYDLRYREGSPVGQWQPWRYPRAWQRTLSRQQTLHHLSPGMTYCFEVRVRDAVGGVTHWSAPQCTARPYDDSWLPAGRAWTQTSDAPGFRYGTATYSTRQGTWLTLQATFSRVALTVYRCSTCGRLEIFAGTTLLKSLDLHATTPRLERWTSPPLLTPQRTLTLRVVSRDEMVAIDDLALLR